MPIITDSTMLTRMLLNIITSRCCAQVNRASHSTHYSICMRWEDIKITTMDNVIELTDRSNSNGTTAAPMTSDELQAAYDIALCEIPETA